LPVTQQEIEEVFDHDPEHVFDCTQDGEKR
jgi:hypothetical protein